jgi:iron(III) transport system permease protein
MLVIARSHLISKVLFWVLLLFIASLSFGPFVILLKSSLHLAPHDEQAWLFILNNQLTQLFFQTLIMITLTGMTAGVLGVALASLVTLTDLPFKKVFNYLFLLPISFPLYLLSYIYVGGLEYAGAVPSFFRNFGIPFDQWITIKSLPGLVFVFSLGLYPYVYLLTRSSLLKMGEKMILAARSQGLSNRATYFKVILPYAYPWIFSGMLLAMMEALADFGGVTLFHYETLTTSIYTTWLSLYSLPTAARLSGLLIFIALVLYAMEARAGARARHTTLGGKPIQRPFITLKTKQKGLALFFACLVVFLSVGFPLIQLLLWLPMGLALENASQYIILVAKTVTLALSATSFTLLLALALLFAQRALSGARFLNLLSSLCLLGYALPGTLIAVAVVLFFQFFGVSLGVTSLFLILGLGIRFLTVGHRPLFSGMKAIHPNILKASQNLGAGTLSTFKRITLPLLAPSILASVMLLFIEIIKEMPITLMLRPFGLSTLATRLFELTTEGEWERASLAGLTILLLGLIGPYLLSRLGDRV